MKIVAAAVRYRDLIVFMPRPARHSDILRVMYEVNLHAAVGCEQGFLTDDGEFVDRLRAREIVVTTRQQRIRDTHPHQLFSEDLW